jgi:pilus assembly protein CpaF
MNKIITFWSSEPGVGRRTLAKELALEWVREEKDVLVLEEGEPNLSEAPERWVPRFRKLSPMILRNYLADPDGDSYASLTLRGWPPNEILESLLEMVRRAFEWVLVVGPQGDSEGNVILLDSSDLLLWVERPNDTSAARWDELLSFLARQHLPISFARRVINRLSRSSIAHEEALAVIPEDPLGLARWEALRRLAIRLGQEPGLYRVRERTLEGKEAEEQVVAGLKSQVQPELLRVLHGAPVEFSSGGSRKERELAQTAVENHLAADPSLGGCREERSQIVTRVLEEVLGLGPLEPLLKDPEVTEILVNGHGCIYVERGGKLFPTAARFPSESQLRTIIDRIVAPIGRRVDESMPLCDARLADGSRVNIVLPPLALDGPALTVRKFAARKLGLEDLVGFGSLNAAMADFLRRAVVSRKNIVVSGGTGSGKTTLLNALSSAIPDEERIVTIEDAAELRLQKPHVVRLESRPANAEGQGAIPIRRLVINALRMRPDRIIVGECRGGEALDMLQAMNTGHDGSLTTVHANSPRDALGRLETLVLMAGIDLPVRVVREQIRSGVHLIIHQARISDGSRKVVSITELTGMEGEILTTQELYRWKEGRFEATGLVARWS